MSCSWPGIEILEDEPECIHLDCDKKLGMALVTYFEKKVNFNDPSNENISYISFSETLKKKNQKKDW